jgi:hypothetical protein
MKDNIKPIYSMIQQEAELGDSKNYLCYVILKFYLVIIRYTFNFIKIWIKFNSRKNGTIIKFLDFFKLVESYFIDFIMRRLDVSEFIKQINHWAISNLKLKPEIKSALSDLTTKDFVTALSKFYIFRISL